MSKFLLINLILFSNFLVASIKENENDNREENLNSVMLTLQKNKYDVSYFFEYAQQGNNVLYKKISNDAYALICTLIFDPNNFEKFFDEFTSLKLGVSILNLYTREGCVKALQILKTLACKERGVSCVRGHEILTNISSGVHYKKITIDNIMKLKKQLQQAYPEIEFEIDRLIPDQTSIFDDIYDFIFNNHDSDKKFDNHDNDSDKKYLLLDKKHN